MSTPYLVQRHTLANGLRVCVVPDPHLPVVAVDVSYHVGARDEQPGTKGFAHLFEHLMFAGSQNVAAGELSACLSRVGGAPNASTDFDITRYFVTVPRHALELALWLEADRMGGMLTALDQKMLDTEREIVGNERRQTMETVPFGLLWQRIFAQLYPEGHPYHWVPMGSLQQLADADLDLVRSFFTAHYAPDNAVVTLAGDIDAQEGFALAQRYFGGIPRSAGIAPHPDTKIGPLEAPLVSSAPERGPVPASVAAWRLPDHEHPQWPALQMAAVILGQGEASHLGRRLVLEDATVTEVSSEVMNLHGDTDALMLGMWLAGDADLQECQRTRDELISELGERGPNSTDLRRAQAFVERRLYSHIASRVDLAGHVGSAELRWPGRDPIGHDLQRFAEVGAGDIRDAVCAWLTPQQCSTVLYESESEQHPPARAGDIGDIGALQPDRPSTRTDERRAQEVPA